jgi:hypothetical protein
MAHTRAGVAPRALTTQAKRKARKVARDHTHHPSAGRSVARSTAGAAGRRVGGSRVVQSECRHATADSSRSCARTPQPRRALDSPWNGASLILLSRSVVLCFTCCRASRAALVQPRCSMIRPALCLWSVCMPQAAACMVDRHVNGEQFARRHSSDGAELPSQMLACHSDFLDSNTRTSRARVSSTLNHSVRQSIDMFSQSHSTTPLARLRWKCKNRPIRARFRYTSRLLLPSRLTRTRQRSVLQQY